MRKRILSLAVACGFLFQAMSASAAAQNILINGTAVDIPADMGSIREPLYPPAL